MSVRQQTAFSLIELMATTATLSILITIAIPAWQQNQAKQRLQQVAEGLAQDLRSARSLSLRHNTPYFIHYDSTESDSVALVHSTTASDWCHTLSIQSDCHCRTDDPTPGCQITRGNGRDHPGVYLTEARFGSQHYTRFDPVRGTALFGRLRLEDDFQRQLQINVSLLGRIRICQPQQGRGNTAYPAC